MFKKRGLMIDCSRNAVKKPETVKKLIDLMEKIGFNTLMLYTEDTYEISSEPYFGYLRGRYSKAELLELDEYAASHGIELIPCIQTLAHLNTAKRWYQSRFDVNDILLTDNDETYDLIDKMLATVSECFKTRTVHIGMDEAHMLGRGKHLDIYGYEERSQIMKRHLEKVSAIAEKYGLKPLMWGDMFSKEIDDGKDGKDYLPSSVTPVYWDYYSPDKAHYDKKMASYKHFAPDFWFAGGLWTWTGFCPHNEFSVRASHAAIQSATECGTENIFFTIWGDNGAETPIFSILPSMYYVSRMLDGEFDDEKIKREFYDFSGIEYDDFMLLDLPEINNTDANKNRFVNPEKYMLYADPFAGLFDFNVRVERDEVYARAAEKLKKLSDNAEYGYLFATLGALCHVLCIKNSIGVRTREAYRSRNNGELVSLINEYNLLYDAISDFYNAFRAQWMKENKSFGFEVQDMRIGGLMLRIRHCREVLSDFLDGKIKKIEELDEELLPLFPDIPEDICFNDHSLTFSVSVV